MDGSVGVSGPARYAQGMRRILGSACATAALVLTLTACADDSAQSDDPTPSDVATTLPSSVQGSETPSDVKVPEVRVDPGPLMSGEDYLQPGSMMDFQFTTGAWKCVLTQEVAGCTGPVPNAEPEGATAAKVIAGGAASFETTTDGLEPEGAAKELPAGKSLPNGKFVCAAFDDGVQCETTDKKAGFHLTESEATSW